MNWKPNNSQKDMLTYLAGDGGKLVVANMGKGKTAVTLHAVARKLLTGDAKRVLIVAPKAVIHLTWEQEAKKWGMPITFCRMWDSKITKADVYLINYDRLHSLAESGVGKGVFDLIVFDEITRLKSPRTDVTKAARLLSREATVWGLTGTLAVNRLEDLFMPVFLTMGEVPLGRSWSAYRESVSRPKFFGSYEREEIPGARERTASIIGPLIYQDMTASHSVEVKTDVIGIQLTGEAREMYRTMAEDCVLEYNSEAWKIDRERRMADRAHKIACGGRGSEDLPEIPEEMPEGYEPIVVAANAAVLINKLLQIAGGSVYDVNRTVVSIHNAKLESCKETCRKGNWLIFYAYKHQAEELTRLFPEAENFTEASDKTRPDIMERWNKGGIRILLAHPRSAGHGLNLQFGGSQILWYTLPWSLELFQQANARIARMGQDKNVTVKILLVEDTADYRVYSALTNRTSQHELLTQLLNDNEKAT